VVSTVAVLLLLLDDDDVETGGNVTVVPLVVGGALDCTLVVGCNVDTETLEVSRFVVLDGVGTAVVDETVVSLVVSTVDWMLLVGSAVD
jgi:hypothetical protein